MSEYISLYNELNGNFNNITVDGDSNFDNITVTGTVDLSGATVTVNKIGFGNGTESSPSIYWNSNSNTGLFKKFNDTVSVTTGGNEAFRFGNTSLPNNSLLPLYCTGTMSCSPYSFSCGNINILGSILSSSGANIGGQITCPSILTGLITSTNITSNAIDTQGYTITCGTLLSGNITSGSIDTQGNTIITHGGAIDTQGGSITSTKILNSNGLYNAPSYSFSNDSSCGMFLYNPGIGAYGVSITAQGQEVMRFDPYLSQIFSAITHTGYIYNTSGNSTNPSYGFSADSLSGLYLNSYGNPSITANATEIMRFNPTLSQLFSPLTINGNLTNTGIIYNSNGSSIAPSWSFSSDNTLGLFKVGAVTLGIASNGIEVARFNNSLVQINVALAMGSNTISCGGITLSSANTNSFVYSNSSKSIVSTASATNGQLLIGGTGVPPALATITGVTNQTIITNGSNSIQISLPQNIDTLATPTFSRLNLIGSNTYVSTAGYNLIQLNGTDSSSSASSMQFFTTVDNFPNMQLLGYTHNNINLSFDGYFDGSWRSSSTTSNYQISKNNNKLNINYSPSTTAGSVLTWKTGIVLNDTGKVIIGNNTTNASGVANLQLYGLNNSNTSPSLVCYTDQDNIPNFNINGLQHNNININFDAYWNGTNNLSSSTSANYQISKNNSRLYTYYSPATLVSNTVTFSIGTCINSLGQVSLGTDIVANGTAKLTIYGANNSSGGPHISTITTVDNYPIVNVASLQHDSIYMGFDTYHDGSNLRSSSATANFLISKISGQLQVSASSGNAQGAIPSMNLGTYWDTSGNMIQNKNLTLNGYLSSSGTPYYTVFSNSTISIANNTNVNFTAWDTVVDNQGGLTNDGTNLTFPVAGVYYITWTMNYAVNATGNRGTWVLYVGNRYGNQTTAGFATNIVSLASSCIIKVSAGDSILVRNYQNSGGALNVGTVTGGITARLSIIKLC